MRVCVTGFKGGMVRDTLVGLGVQLINVDITLEDELKSEIYATAPDVVIHAAAITDVDRCEKDKKLAFDVNVRGTTYVAEACEDIGAKMIYLSTCHIFDGKSITPYTEQSIPRPVNTYGMTKWMGEVSAQTFTDPIIVRISKLFSHQTFRPYAQKLDGVIRPTFIFRNYIHVTHFCAALLKVAETHYNFDSIVNISSVDWCDDYNFFREGFYKLGYPKEHVLPRIKEDNSRYVARPNYGVLDIGYAQLRGISLPTIVDGLDLLKGVSL